MIRWAARATLAILVFLPSLLVSVDVKGGPLFSPDHPIHGYGNMPLGLFILNGATIIGACIVAGGLLVLLVTAASGNFDR